MPNEQESTPQSKSKMGYFIVISAGTVILLATPVVVLLFLGLFLDNYFNTKPVLVITGVVIGSVGGIVNIYRLMKLMK